MEFAVLIRSSPGAARPDAVALAVLAESLGLAAVWVSSTAGDAIAIAAATRRVRIGLVAPSDASPRALARELAELDVASGGRAALAGRDGLHEVARLLVEETVQPPAVQDPHPGLWLAGEGTACVARAAGAGLGVLVLDGLGPRPAAAAVRDHAAVLASDRWSATGFAVVERVAVCVGAGSTDLDAFATAGVDELVLVLDATGDDDAGALRAFAARRPGASGPVRVPVDPAALEAGIARGLSGAAPAPNRRPGWRRRTRRRGERAFRDWVVRAGEDDRRLDRVVGSPALLTVLFTAMAARYEPARAKGFAGELCFVLRRPGADRPWTLVLGPDGARARRGAATDAALTLTLSPADMARLAAGTLDPATALLTGRLDLEGDFALAVRLGELFGLEPVL